mmetsp:Transcript_11345/g.26724  ORF Transcript_11345/g.26724 Transcript_11345/m.26724 type:complete len:249 (+) Transcript_11345:396-1142(+)
MASTVSFAIPNFFARSNRFSNSSLESESKLFFLLFVPEDLLFLGPSRPFPPSTFFCLAFFPSPRFPLSRLRDCFSVSSFFVVGVVIPNLAARAFFFSSKVIPFLSVTFGDLAGAGVSATTAVDSLALPLPLPLPSTFLASSSKVSAGSSVLPSGATTSSFSTSGAFALGAGAGAGAGDGAGGVAVAEVEGASAKPNSSSSRRTCNLFTSSALSPSVDNPRLESSARRSDTFIFFTSIVPMLVVFRMSL